MANNPDEWLRSATYIGGQWRRPTTGQTHPVENPATEMTIGTTAEAGADDADAAVEAAAEAASGWARTSVDERIAIVGLVHSELLNRRDQLIETTIAEVGAPIRVAREAHVDAGLDVLSAYLEAATEVPWEERVGNSLIRREGIGVAACITPWNYPFYQVMAKIGGALLSGSTVVLKPAELTPLSAYLLTDAIDAAGLPAGVFNLVPGPGRVVGETLARHPRVDAVSFTGSTAVGARVAAGAAESIKRVSLELGGKSASLVLPGADLSEAVPTTVDMATLNSGQTCTAWSRLLVPEEDLPRVLELAAARAEALVMADPHDEATDLGPVVSAAQRDTVVGFIRRAASDGARIVAGGPLAPDGADRGYFVRPTVVANVAPNAEIVRDEVFGPVLTVQAYRSVAEGIAMANDSDYGLAGAVWGASDDEALDVARQLRTGQVDINGGEFNPAAPFGGYRRSGNGRELGRWGIEEFLETQSLQLRG